MTFNQFVLYCIGVAVVLIASGFFWLGVIIIAVLVLLYAFALYLAWDVLEFWSKLSTVWQDIPDIIAIAETTWFSKRGINTSSISGLYRKLSIYKGLFEVKVDEAVIDAFERLHPDLRLSESVELPLLTKAMFYVGIVLQYKPEYMSDIQRAVLVRKRVGGKKKPAKEKHLQFLKPVYN